MLAKLKILKRGKSLPRMRRQFCIKVPTQLPTQGKAGKAA